MAQRLSIRRRSRGSQSLTAAAQRVTDPKAFRSSPLNSGGAADWQEQAWIFLELVGELAYYASWRSASASRVRFVASELSEDGEPTGGIDGDSPEALKVRNIVNSIAGGAAGQSQLLKRHIYLLTIPGECWAGMIVRNPERETDSQGRKIAKTPMELLGPGALPVEQWFTFNKDEIATKSQETILTLPDGTKHIFDPEVDVLFRVWEPHPKNATLPVSPVWANRAVLSEIVDSTATIKNASKSRLVGNGIMFVPQELSLPSQASPTAVPVGSEAPPPGAVTDWEPNSSQDLQDLLAEVATVAIKEPDSLAALLPIIASGPGEWLKNIQWLRPTSDIPETALKTRTESIRRLAMGLDVSAERLLGMGDSNHWTAWLTDESDVRIHIAPPVETVCNAFTQEVLRPLLLAEGIDPDKYVIWHDDTRLTQDPDKKDEAQQAHDRGALTSQALLKYLGFDETDGYDLTTEAGWVELAMDKSAKDPSLIPLFAPLLGSLVEGIKAPAQPAIGGPAPEPAPEEAPKEEPATEDTAPQEAETEDGLNAAAFGFTRLSVNRSLEMANKRRRTRTNAASFQGVPITEAHYVLTPVAAAEVPALIQGWDSCLDDATCIAFGFDPEKFRAVVLKAASRSLCTSAPWGFPVGDMKAARL